jgi:hypothetical protein
VRDLLHSAICCGRKNIAAIVTNPPYKLALQFIDKAILEGVGFHAWLLRTNFLESVERKGFFEEHPPSRIWISSARITMHRLAWKGKRAGSNVSYAWYVWDAGAPRGPVVHWFDWHDHVPARGA